MFAGWFRLVATTAEMTSAALRTGEALTAADRVIRSRSKTIADACSDPISADYAELGRFIPEKMAAAGRAASDVMTESMAIWTDSQRQWQRAGYAMPYELALRAMSLYPIALKPFHATVTANDRRLRRKR
ncbi:MAG: hypothetical protein AB7L36_11950 [Sphingomonadaceae bacterium]